MKKLILILFFICLPFIVQADEPITCQQFQLWTKPIQKMYVNSVIKGEVQNKDIEFKACAFQQIKITRKIIIRQCKIGMPLTEIVERAMKRIKKICPPKYVPDENFWPEWEDEDLLFEYPYRNR